MLQLTREFIRNRVADSAVIFERGVQIFNHGSFVLHEAKPQEGFFTYRMDGNYGDYITEVQVKDDGVTTQCSCPYPGVGCKHTVAALLDAGDVIGRWRLAAQTEAAPQKEEPYLTPEEIKQLALEDREKRARLESFSLTEGEMLKGEHLVETEKGRAYTITLHDPKAGAGHCTCLDYLTNRLGTCKHILYLTQRLKKKRDFQKRLGRERFPFVDIYWDSVSDQPKVFYEQASGAAPDVQAIIERCFRPDGTIAGGPLANLLPLIDQVKSDKRFRIQESVLERLDEHLRKEQAVDLEQRMPVAEPPLKTQLYGYQRDGVRFALFKEAALIGDEMGLGKTLQAVALAILKKEIFGFSKVLIVTLASLKEQWKREIERFSHESAAIIAGSAPKRRASYFDPSGYFKITNYEAVLKDITIIKQFKPDIVILDEAQRIKNFTTKTADAVKQIPRKHALVLTGTPLENKLEDVYSIVQFLDPRMLSPLWRFAADHFMLSRAKKDKILGYRNLDQLHERLKSIVIRRRKEEVLFELPEQVVNNYYLPLHATQKEIHDGYKQYLIPLLNKKFLTPMDLRRMQEILLHMRMVCDSTYLIDRKTHISPKLKELEGIIDELVVQNNRKMIIFSEWTTMTFLIARHLSEAGIGFVELSGKVPVHKRQNLIDEFTRNPACKVFLSTDAGGTGLNLQAADCVVNFELPWNPARINQRIGRVHRIGQKSRCINVINLITKGSIEESIMTGLRLKTDLFDGVFDGKTDMVEFSHEKRVALLNQLREMMGEEPVVPASQNRPAEEIPEDAPYYLNPQALQDEHPAPLDVAAEEQTQSSADQARAEALPSDDATTQRGDGAYPLTRQPAERIETVLNTGMQFISGLLEMATGQKLTTSSQDGRMLAIDKTTGEVTLKFKLPGFSI
jgi:superfamily II DNA or RNA helicase